MTIRSKVTLSALFFMGLSSAVAAWCYLNIQREEAAFAASRQAMRTHSAATDIEYFLTRQVRALENYVLLSDEAEKLQRAQAAEQIRQRLVQWEEGTKLGQTRGDEIETVRSVHTAIDEAAKKVEKLLESDKRALAMEAVEKDFAPATTAALADFKKVRQRTEEAKSRSEQKTLEELRRNHWALLGGVGLVAFFGLMSLVALHRSVMRPIQSMQAWADRWARGERGLHMEFTGRNELTDLARSIGEMAIQLTRPKTTPVPLNLKSPYTQPIPQRPGSAQPPSRGAEERRRKESTAPGETPSMNGPHGMEEGSPLRGGRSPATLPADAVADSPRSSAEKAGLRPAASPRNSVEGAAKAVDSNPAIPQEKVLPAEKPKDVFDEAVDEFRDILAQMAGQEISKSRKIG